jgi:hypothetical protein
MAKTSASFFTSTTPSANLTEMPMSVKFTGWVTGIAATSGDHLGYMADAAKASWHAARRDSRRQAIRQQLIKKYNLG